MSCLVSRLILVLLFFLSDIAWQLIDTPFMCSWHILISKPAGEELEVPYSLKPTEETPLDEVCC